MWVYFCGLIASLLIVGISRIKALKKYSNKIKFASVIPFLIISAIRYDVGTDYMYRYVPSYNLIKNGFDVESLEYAFKLLIKFCTMISSNYQMLFIITSFIILIPIFYIMSKKSKCMELSILIFFLGGFFFQSMNILRQYIAIACLLLGYNFIVEKKYVKFLFFYILAISFHTASIVAIVFLFINSKKEIKVPIIILTAIIIFVFKAPIAQVIRSIISMTRFSGYLGTSYDAVDISYFNFIKQLVIYISLAYLFYINKENSRKDKLSVFLLNVQGMAIIFYSLSSIISLFTRVYFFFSIFQIISVPLFITYTNKKNNFYFYIFLVLILYSTFFVNSNVLRNDNEVVPYHSYYNRNI